MPSVSKFKKKKQKPWEILGDESPKGVCYVNDVSLEPYLRMGFGFQDQSCDERVETFNTTPGRGGGLEVELVASGQ